MSAAGKIHIYTFWNPNLCAETIEAHSRVISRETAVKWIVLNDDQTWVAEIGKAVNSGNNICQSCHSRESGNPELDWMPDQVRHDIRYV
jgi:hypothetical protein